MLGVHHDPLLGLQLGRENIGSQEAAGAGVVCLRLCQDGRRSLRHKGIGVDLAVRVGQRDADLLAAVLEAEDLLDLRQRPQLARAVGPGVDHGARPRWCQVGEGRLVVAGEADDLAAPECWCWTSSVRRPLAHRSCARKPCVGREPVLEDDDVVGGLRDLRGGAAGAGRAQGAFVLGRQEGPVEAVTGDGDPVAHEGVVADLARERSIPSGRVSRRVARGPRRSRRSR